MSVMRALLSVLMSLAILWPAGGQRDCCCYRSASAGQQTPAHIDLSALPACCAARLRARLDSEAQADQHPQWRSHCGCKTEWQRAEYTSPPRVAFSVVTSNMTLWASDASPYVSEPTATSARITAPVIVRDSRDCCIQLSRWLA